MTHVIDCLLEPPRLPRTLQIDNVCRVQSCKGWTDADCIAATTASARVPIELVNGDIAPVRSFLTDHQYRHGDPA